MTVATHDYRQGSKRHVAEIKFLIHDLRVEPFINEVIHFHVTLNTDLELHGIEQAQAIHGEDLASLKDLAVSLRKAFREYSNAVRNFSPDQTILRTGRKYVDTILGICDLVLNPLWGRSDQVLVFLPPTSRSVQARNHYRNCVAWIRGVRARILAFLAEQDASRDLREQFDIAGEIEAFTRNVIQGYVAETGRAKVELQVGPLEPAVAFGNLPRFHRMYFNLVMNAVDAMSEKRVGVLRVSEVVEGNEAVLRVRDDGEGMTPEKVAHLMRETVSLDGELHSLGFVFVRQTVADFGGELTIDSRIGEGTTITVRFPRLLGVAPPPRKSAPGETDLLPKLARIDADGSSPGAARAPTGSSPGAATGATEPGARPEAAAAAATAPATATTTATATGALGSAPERPFGELLLDDFRTSKAQHPGSLFAIAVSPAMRVDAFTHRPYEPLWDLAHEDLSPMLFRTTVRGRIEEDEAKQPMLILKPPQDAGEYFDFRELPDEERSMPKFLQMVRDEYIRVARKLIATGLPASMTMVLADAPRFFGSDPTLAGDVPVPLQALAELRASGEAAA
ncbi:MAG: ATP-binding protein [Myxococcales bacterium]|nr:ATP-binding protein [Myxococcales bacterium]